MYTSPETDLAPRHTVESLFAAKLDIIGKLRCYAELDDEINVALKGISGYRPYDTNYRWDYHQAKPTDPTPEEKYVDRICWRYLVRIFFLERYLLCTEYKKMLDEIEHFHTPEFTVENANAWLAGLKDLINDNVRTLVKQVYRDIIDGTYRTGSSYNAPRKKRNNNGVDKRFILSTNDYSSLFGYWSRTPTITDDLEKVCYLLDGKTVPEKTAKDTMRETKSAEYSCEYFSLKACANGNTHYVLSDETRDKLNRYGPEGAVLGENIKIKIVPNRWDL